MDKHLIGEYVGRVARKVSDEADVQLVHVETAGTRKDLLVRIYIDRDGGVTLDDCSRVSRSVEDVLDTEDIIPSRYVLEVSSPGIERELYSLADFVRFSGQLARVKTRSDIDGQKNFVGTIVSVEENEISLADRTKGLVKFPYEEVVKANLKIDLSKEFGHKQ